MENKLNIDEVITNAINDENSIDTFGEKITKAQVGYRLEKNIRLNNFIFNNFSLVLDKLSENGIVIPNKVYINLQEIDLLMNEIEGLLKNRYDAWNKINATILDDNQQPTKQVNLVAFCKNIINSLPKEITKDDLRQVFSSDFEDIKPVDEATFVGFNQVYSDEDEELISTNPQAIMDANPESFNFIKTQEIDEDEDEEVVYSMDEEENPTKIMID